jgi:lambda repressor-like predicted transcriptional regulator
MTTITAHPRKTQGPDINRPAGALFAKVFAEVYLTASDDIKEVIESMSKIVNDPAADADEQNAALDTLLEVLFPPKHPEQLGVDLEEEDNSVEAKRAKVAATHQEATFAEAVLKLMKERGITQKVLAEKIGIGQPAISMILSRKCRPQRATVQKIAKALGVEPKRIWTE